MQRFDLRQASILVLLFSQTAIAAELPKEDQARAERYFETQVRPLLAQHCFRCHGAKEQKSDLRLDVRKFAFHGGIGGPVIVPGDPDESVLIQAVRGDGYEMPPENPLSEKQVAILEKWVADGAYWPATDPSNLRENELFSEEDRNWWAFQPVVSPEPPKVREGQLVHNPIDQFVLERLNQAGIEPAPPATRRRLIRRVYFDMLGVPPTEEEVQQFLTDPTSTPYENLVDRVLADPRYGQRWSTHWLDVVRYADSDGYRQDAYRNKAWKYRDYVIRSLNEDKSYKRFLQEQLAGDELAPDDPDAMIATYFLRAGVYEYNSRDAEGQQVLINDELTDTVGDVFLGMGIACAHCHDHKYDPILHEDYYRLQAFFAPLVWKDDHPIATQQELDAYKNSLQAWEKKNEELLAKIEVIESKAREKQANKAVTMFPREVQAIYNKPPEERNTYDQKIRYLVDRQVEFEYSRLKNGIPKSQHETWETLKKELQTHISKRPAPLPSADVCVDAPGPIHDVTIPGKRNAQAIEPGFLSILDPEPAQIEPPSEANSSGRRLALAKWLSRDDNPLAPRVMVNRVWQYHFGSGLSPNASDFGRLGQTPSHPQLLDWLTSQFIANDWKLKPLHRQILLSATYRQSSLVPMSEVARKTDPSNGLLWKFPSRRLAGEQIRDAMLQVSGQLRNRDGGSPASTNDTYRTIYTKKMRNSPDPLLASFDTPPGFSSVAKRNTTTTATQSLLMINGAWTLKRAEAMASKLNREENGDIEAMIRRAYLDCFNRPAESAEVGAAIEFLRQQTKMHGVEKKEEVKSDSLLEEPQMKRWDTAFNINDAMAGRYLNLPKSESVPGGNFTIEAIVFHRTMFKNANVRTIAARWNNSKATPGWAFGVTSEQSSYRPRNLILQLIGKDAGGTLTYEVVPSNLRIPSGKPYYVAAAVDYKTGTATFFAKDMSYDESELETAVVKHSIRSGDVSSQVRFTIGGRDNQTGHNWDGLLDDIRWSNGTITDPEQLEINVSDDLVTNDTIGLWRFIRSHDRGPLAEAQRSEFDLAISAADGRSRRDPQSKALIDFCHVLLNSSEFQFVD